MSFPPCSTVARRRREKTLGGAEGLFSHPGRMGAIDSIGGGCESLPSDCPPAMPSVLVVAHYDTTTGNDADLDHVRDGGSPTGTKTGNVLIISGGKFSNCMDLADASPAYVEYSGSNIIKTLTRRGTVTFWYQPQYTGSPATHQFMVSCSSTWGSWARGVEIRHTTGGNLLGYLYSNTGTTISQCVKAWSPTSGTWYHLEYGWDKDDSYLFIGGTLQDSDPVTGTRTAPPQWMGVGRGATGGAIVNNYYVDELIVYDTLKHSSNFTPPTAPILIVG